MTLQQLRYLCEIVDSGLNLSRAAEQLHVSQPGISKIVKALEMELGLEILVRRGNRIVELTDAGREVLVVARRIVNDARDLKGMAADRHGGKSGVLRVATTHLQARYALLDVIRKFAGRYPDVDLHLTQGSMKEIIDLVATGQVELGVSAVPGTLPESIVALDAYPIERCVITPPSHPLLALKKSTIKDLAKYPLIMYDETNNAGAITLREFRQHGLRPRVSMKATDVNVIKAYVAAGLGIAVVQRMALESTADRNIRVLSNTHTFPPSMTSLIFRRGQHLRAYIYDLIRMVSPRLTGDAVDQAVRRQT
jgi:DNA-binding transcriptional LysR family regulator